VPGLRPGKAPATEAARHNAADLLAPARENSGLAMGKPARRTGGEADTLMRRPIFSRCLHTAVFALLTGALPTLADVPFGPEMVAFLRLDGDALDASPHGRNGQPVALTFQTNRFGFANSSGRFDGTATRVGVPFPSAFNLLPVTVSVWMNLDDNEETDIALVSNYYTASANGWGLFVTGDFVRAWYYGPSGSVPTGFLQTSPLARGSWMHLIATFDSGGGKLYLDGRQVAGRGWSGSPNPSTSALGLLIGEMLSPNGSRKNFRGGIDDVRIYSRALSEPEVVALYEYDANPFRRARAVAESVNGFLVGVTIEEGGQGFAEPPKVEILGNGTGAKAVATVAHGRVTGIVVTDAGSGYTGPVIVRVATPPRAPRVSIAVQTVRVTLTVVEGRRYRLESSSDLVDWRLIGEFAAEADTIFRDFSAAETGSFFRIEQLPTNP